MFGYYVMLPVEVVKALLDVAAMFLGLFGVFVVYLLSYYDSRIDKLEKEVEYEKSKLVINIWDNPEEEMKAERDIAIKNAEKKLGNIKAKKGFTANTSLGTFVFFMVALVSSIVTLGLLSADNHGWFLEVVSFSSSATLAALFTGILMVFILIRRIGQEV